MIENEQEFISWCHQSDLAENTTNNYVSWLSTASERIGENISPRTLSSEEDVAKLIASLSVHPDMTNVNDRRIPNTKSAMRKYVTMVRTVIHPQQAMLNPLIEEKLREAHDALKENDGLLSAEDLELKYSDFRQRFGPEKLRSLEGQELLELIHGRGNNDSLVYTLEFQCREFGGIGGGSAHKFGLFKRQADGRWITGSAQNERVVDEEEACSIALQHRDELLAGVHLLESLPENSSDADYINFQQQIIQSSPTLYKSGWAHKYWHMLFPEKLDDYHNEDLQRSHLIKLLVEPPSMDGLFVCAGIFQRTAKYLVWPVSHFTRVLNEVNTISSYWKIGTQLGADADRSIWNDMYQGGYIAIGWGVIGPLDDIAADTHSTHAELKQAIAQKLSLAGFYNNDQGTRTRKSSEILNFVTKVKNEDLVVAVEGQRVKGICRVIGEYYYEETGVGDAYHRHRVEWLSTESWRLLENEAPLTTFKSLKRANNLLEVEKRILNAVPQPLNTDSHPPITQPLGQTQRPEIYTIENMKTEGVFLDEPEIERIKHRLESKKNLILQGAPGVGKTFVAKKLAYLLMGEKADDRIVSVQFHPSYSYEDFVRGYRPTNEAGKFQLVDGTFWKLCDKARINKAKKHVILIDEINRGNLSQIFGELFMLLEADKRNEHVSPLYSKLDSDLFSIPDNVYLIGTMNIADRSLALVDYALRRRFAFVTLEPQFNSGLFSDWLKKQGASEEIILQIMERMSALNNRISKDSQLGEAFRIGHSFFCQKPAQGYSDDWFKEIIETEIIPLLEEYWHDNRSQLDAAIAELRQ